MLSLRVMTALVPLAVVPLAAQTTADPFPERIGAGGGAIEVGIRDFATLPEIGGEAARMMLLLDEPGTRRLFVNDMRGPLYAVSYDGRSVIRYLDVEDDRWGFEVQANGRERGFQSFAFHPQFNDPGTPGFGKLYTWVDVVDTVPPADFSPGGGEGTHDTVLLEWTARNPGGSTYDGGPPRTLMRLEQPFANHNAGQIAFNPLVGPGDLDFGVLYVGVADGGSGGDPLNLAQNLGSIFGKILRVHPLGSNAPSGRYGIPADNPFAADGDPGTLGEIYAYGVRNPQRFGWDARNGNLFLAEIGQNIVEELSLVTRGANLGWNRWEGSFGYISRSEVSTANPRGDPSVSYPVVEYGHMDPELMERSAITGVVVVRGGEVLQLMNRVLFGDMPSGEIFHIDADRLPQGGEAPIGRVVFRTERGQARLLDLVETARARQGKEPAGRVDLRFGTAGDRRVFILNKHDGTIRVLVAGSS